MPAGVQQQNRRPVCGLGEMELGMHRNGKILGRNRKTNTLKQLAEAETEYRMWLLLFFIYFALIFQHCINQTIKCPL